MTIDWLLVVASFGVGIVVGLTGMGGGALMTPMLVFFFGVPPLAAVSSDLVASAIMKPVGSVVHLRRGTVNLELVRWLCYGSVPSAFLGVVVARALGKGNDVQHVVQVALGVALFFAACALVVRAYLRLVEQARQRELAKGPGSGTAPTVTVRRIPTLLIGAVGGLVVGLTSVGSGSLIIIALLMLYPTLKTGQLVGTDLVQAVPLVASAALAHILFGDFQLQITLSLLIGSVPGVYLGARLSAGAPSGIIRRALTVVLLASALKLLGASTAVTIYSILGVVLLGIPLWIYIRHRHGFVPIGRTPTPQSASEPSVKDPSTNLS